MAACALFSGGTNITEDGNVNNGSGSATSPLTSASNSSNMSNEEQQNLHGIMPQPHCDRKMVRKRMASEMDQVNVHVTPPHNASSTTDYPRFPRRSTANMNMSSLEKGSTTTATLAAGTCSNSNNNNNNNNNYHFNNSNHNSNSGSISSRDNVAIPNYPTVTVTTNYSTMLLPSSTTINSSGVAPNYSAHQHHHFQGLVESQSQDQQNPVPAVCGFSGLPLFPSQSQRNRDNNTATTNVRSSGGNIIDVVASSSSPSMDDTSAATSGWIDGILKDLIHSSNSVSIPQLISNVREIIYPCNPNLATILEYRLRLLTESTPQNKRGTEGVPLPPSVSSVKLMNNRVDGIVPNLHFTDASGAAVVVNQHMLSNWGVPPITHHHDNNGNNNTNTNSNPSVSLVTLPSPPPPPHYSPPQEKQPHPQEEDLAATNSAAEVALTRKKKEELREQKKKDEEGLHLLTLLLQCAEAVSAENLEDANKMLLEISQLSTPFGTSAQRVAAYFSEAISARLVSSCLGIYATLPHTHQIHKVASAFQVFNGISPFVKFSHFTANQAIQEAFEREERVHIIDLDIMQGLQWPGLFYILASRPGGAPYVRLTGLGTSMEALEATGKRLSDFANKLCLPFEFFPVAEKVGNLDPERLNVSKTEAVAVHWLQHSLYDVTGSDTNTLWLLQR